MASGPDQLVRHLVGESGTGGVTDHGALTGLSDDDHPVYLYTTPQSTAGAGRAGGQFLVGGTAASEELYIRGTSAADQGLVRFDAPIVFEPTPVTNSAYCIDAAFTDAITVGFIGGVFNASPTLTFSNGLFVWEGLRVGPNIQSLVAPTFAGFTLLQALPKLRAGSGATFNPVNPLVINAGPMVENEFVGTRTVATMIGLNFAPQVRSITSGATMNATAITAVNVSPSWNTASGGTIGFGTVRGVHCRTPAVGLFQQDLGTENLTAYIGLDWDNISFGGTVEKAAVRSAQTAATNAYFLRQTGNAQSVLLGQVVFDADVTGITFGASQDMNMGWAGASNEFFLNFLSTGDDLRFSNPSANRILIQGDVQATEVNLNCDQFSLGAQSGALGQGVGAFVTPARSTSINGGYVDFNLTHAGSLTVADTIGQCFAWNINAISLAAVTGTLNGPVAALNVGGMTTSLVGSADTYGLLTGGRTGIHGTLNYDPIEPAQISGTIQDWAGLVTNTQSNSSRHWALVDGTSTPIIDSIDATAVQMGDTYEITNDGATAITFRDETAAVSGTAANHIRTVAGANIVLGADETLRLRYDTNISRWREIKEP